MRVVFLYGPPGVGKLTVGSELSKLTGFKLMHNHLSVNLVTAVFERDSATWVRMIRQIRRDLFSAAAAEGIDLITTGVFRGDEQSVAAWRMMVLEPVEAGGGSVAWVQLRCEHDELMRRVASESRAAFQKLVDPARLQALLATVNLLNRAPFEPHLSLDVTSLPAATAARRISDHFAL